MRRDTFKKGMMLLQNAYQKEPEPEVFEAFWMVLKDLTDDGFMSAVVRAVNTERFWPTPSVLRDHATGGVASEDGSEVIAVIEHAFSSVGAYHSVDFGDPAINAAVKLLGGWPALCALDVDEWRSYRSRDLVRHALHFRKFGVPGSLGAALPGIIDRKAAQVGGVVANPVRVSLRGTLSLIEGGDHE